jgi:diguanylate cyclase (GGDEF)-like protein/PAS domain S-box-containing protein
LSESAIQSTVLIVHPERQRASEVGQLVERSGLQWTHFDYIPDSEFIEQREDFIATVVFESLFHRDDGAVQDLRQYVPERVVLVGLMDGSVTDSPALFGAGVDLILYEPLVLADIERTLAFANTVHGETREQARDRLRKMTALHELAIASGHRTGSPGWLDNLIASGAEILGPDALAMWSLDPRRESITCAAAIGLTEDYIRAAEQRVGAFVSVYEEIPKQLSTHWLTEQDQSDSEPFRIVAPDAARSLGIERIAWLPVRDSQRLYGHLSFYFTSETAFERYDLVLADAFASIVAATLGTFWLQTEIRRTNRLYREHVESSPDGVLVCHLDGTIERSNPAIETITGRDQYEVIGEHIFEWFTQPEELPWDVWADLVDDGPPLSVEVWLTRKNGERRRVQCFGRAVSFPDPRRLLETEHRVQIVVRDVTSSARRLVELELFHDLTRLISDRGSLEEAYELVASRLHEYLNYRLVSISEVVDGTRLRIQAYRTNMQLLMIPPLLDVSMGLCGRAVRENRSLLVEDVQAQPEYISIDDEVTCELVSVIRVGGEPIGIIDIQSDASQPLKLADLQLADSIAAHLGLLIEQVTIQERLERQALTDPLTGMANRRAFMRQLQSLVSSQEDKIAALLLVELDHFKSVNDRYGHLFGDEMLKQVANRLRQVLRERDVLARYGGDEIAMVFFGVNATQAREIAERLRSSIADVPFHFDGQSADLTVSIGIALYPYHGSTPDELIAEADRAMYVAKLNGRNSVVGALPHGD